MQTMGCACQHITMEEQNDKAHGRLNNDIFCGGAQNSLRSATYAAYFGDTLLIDSTYSVANVLLYFINNCIKWTYII